MKLQSITLVNFGVYAQHTFQFDAAPVVLVYGQNESGKTTALNGIRQTLYGFPVRTPYLVRQGMRGQATMVSQTGSQIEFSRKKARVDEVAGTVDGNPVSADTLAHLLCNLSLDDYQSLFGFSLLELQRGEDALKTTPLTQALAGGGLDGMTRLESLQSDLSGALTDLYKARGSTSPINVLLREIQQTRESLRQAQVLPSAVKQLQAERAELQERAAELREQHAAAIHRRSQLQRSAKAQPLCVTFQSLTSELEKIEIPESVDSRTVANWSEFNRQRKELASQEKELRSSAHRDQLLLKQLGGHNQLSGHEPAIQLLGGQAAAIEEKRARRQQLSEHLATAQTRQQSLLDGLNLKELTSDLRNTNVAPHVRDELDQLSSELAELSQQEIAAKTRLSALKESNNNDTDESLALDDDELLQLQSALDDLREAEAKLQRLEQLRQAQADDGSIAQLHHQLSSQLKPDAVLDEDFHFSSQPNLEAIAEKHTSIEQELASEQREQAKLKSEITELQRRCQSVLQPEDNELLREESTLKQQRDAIMDQWLDELTQPLIAASIDAQQQQQRLEQLQAITESLDANQRRMIRSAKSLAERAYLDDALAERTAQYETAGKKIEVLHASLLQTAQLFYDELEHLPIKLGPVDVLLKWTADFRTWQLQQQKASATAKQVYIQQGVVAEFRSALIDLWPTAISHTASSSSLAQQLQRFQLQAQQSADSAARRQKVQQECAGLAKRLQQLSSRKSEISAKYLTWLNQFPVAGDWPLSAAGRLVDSLQQLQGVEQSIQRSSDEAKELDRILEQFAANVNELVGQLPISLPTGLPEQHARTLLTQLQSLQKDQEQRAKLSASVEHNESRLEQVTTELRRVDDRLADICATVGDQDPHMVQQTMQRISRAEKIRTEIAQLRASLTVLAAGEELGAFIAQTLESNASDSQLELHELQLEINELEGKREECNRAIGVLTERFDRFSQNNRVAELLQKLAGQRAELSELAQQWILFKTGHHILNRSIELFAEENEPELIRLARGFLSRLTDGRYVGVEHQRGKGGGFLVRAADGAALTPTQLSSGTREQLYLALRMAYISHHCSQHEPLPVLMDDCFVNFDDDRMHHAIEAVGQWRDDIQTVIFSCHRRTRDAVESLLPTAKIIDLQAQAELAMR
ncbi:MAG: YhaN family protein [Aureliella sp.]